MMTEMSKPLVLILCTGNSCRSHMAEAVLRREAGAILRVESAGSSPAGYVHPTAIKVLGEIGLDLSGHRSKHLDEFLREHVETVITVCDNANEACPIFPGKPNRHHWSFPDPVKANGTPEEIEQAFREIRDAIDKVFSAYAAGRQDQQEHRPQTADRKAKGSFLFLI